MRAGYYIVRYGRGKIERAEVLYQRYWDLLRACIEKHGLELDKLERGQTHDSVWLANYFWADETARQALYNCKSRNRRAGLPWYYPPVEMWRVESMIDALEHILKMPASLVRWQIEDYCTMKPEAEYMRLIS